MEGMECKICGNLTLNSFEISYVVFLPEFSICSQVFSFCDVHKFDIYNFFTKWLLNNREMAYVRAIK